MARKYNRYAVPTGRVNVNRGVSNITPESRERARSRSFVATCQMRAKLAAVQIIQGDDSSWLHVVGDKIVARFASVTDAVAAL
jgi:hypothetical protein